MLMYVEKKIGKNRKIDRKNMEKVFRRKDSKREHQIAVI